MRSDAFFSLSKKLVAVSDEFIDEMKISLASFWSINPRIAGRASLRMKFASSINSKLNVCPLMLCNEYKGWNFNVGESMD